jgi:uncharacterized paraquat-inducible protein A
MENHYCSECLSTRRFVPHGDYCECERCKKRLWYRREEKREVVNA